MSKQTSRHEEGWHRSSATVSHGHRKKTSAQAATVNWMVSIIAVLLTLMIAVLMVFNAPIVTYQANDRSIRQVSLTNYFKNRQPVKYIEGEINQRGADKLTIEYKEDADQSFNDGLDLYQTIEGQFTVLFLGFDSEDNGNGFFHDVNYLMQFNLQTASLNILQIPRDTYMPAYTTSSTCKFNSIYTFGRNENSSNIQRVVTAVQENYGVPVDAYVTTSCDNIVDIVDIVGGIPIDMPYRIVFEADKVIEKGEQVLSGLQSEWLVRFRYGYLEGDIGRVQAQRLFMAAAMKKAISMNDVEMMNAVDKVYDEELIATDMSLNDIARLADLAGTIEMENVHVFMLPGEDTIMGEGDDAQAIWSTHKRAALKLLNEYFRTQQVPLRADQSTIMEFIPEGEYNDTTYDNNSASLQEIDEAADVIPAMNESYKENLQ